MQYNDLLHSGKIILASVTSVIFHVLGKNELLNTWLWAFKSSIFLCYFTIKSIHYLFSNILVTFSDKVRTHFSQIFYYNYSQKFSSKSVSQQIVIFHFSDC